jgi:hypothetical protein
LLVKWLSFSNSVSKNEKFNFSFFWQQPAAPAKGAAAPLDPPLPVELPEVLATLARVSVIMSIFYLKSKK